MAAHAEPGVRSPDNIPLQLLAWVLGCTFIYATLFGAGSVIYGHTTQATMWAAAWIASGVGLLRVFRRL